jgi:LmbE family N-acetylglucosaminyl deacetylase
VSDERSPLPETLSAPPRGRALALVPHADDDVIGCGGTCALHAAQGDLVRIVVIYSGAEGDPERRYGPDELARVRQAEARRGGAHLGLSDYEFWGYPEGHVPETAELMIPARRIAETVAEFRPAHVYAPWIGEYHVDHHIAARVVRMGLALAGFEGAAWGFEVWTPLVPTRIVDITSVYERKVAALREHASQLHHTDQVHKALGMHAHRSLYLPAASRYGEAFRPLGGPSDEDRRFLAEAR